MAMETERETRATCPVCGKAITVVLVLIDDNERPHVFGAWDGDIADEDDDCRDHMGAVAREALVDDAIAAQEEEARAEVARVNAEEIDAMNALDAFNRTLTDAPVVDWDSDEEPF